jgi:hypothetical protein
LGNCDPALSPDRRLDVGAIALIPRFMTFGAAAHRNPSDSVDMVGKIEFFEMPIS